MKFNYVKWSMIVLGLGIIARFLISAFVMPSGDSCFHLNVARYIAENGSIPLHEGLGRVAFARPPLFHFLAAIVYFIFSPFGPSVATWSMNFISPLFGSLTLIVVYLIGKDFFNKKIAFFATLFLSFFPLHLYFSTISHQEALLTFFVTFTIYLLLKKHYFFSAIAAGLTMLSKYQGPFVLIISAFILYKQHKPKTFLIKTALYSSIAFLVALPWYLRNYFTLGNPFWPLFRFLSPNGFESPFTGIESDPSILSLLSFKHVERFYLGLFGVPEGNLGLFSMLPFWQILFAIWFIGTILFLLPVFKGLHSKYRSLLLIWIGSFFAVVIVHTLFSSSYARHFLPALVAIAFLWALGLCTLKKHHLLIASLLFIAILSGFATVEFGKTLYASSQWHLYQEDFNTAQSLSNPTDRFFSPGVCAAFYLHRDVFMTDFEPQVQHLFSSSYLQENEVSHLLLFTEFGPATESRFPKDITLDESFELLYQNPETSAKIYRIN